MPLPAQDPTSQETVDHQFTPAEITVLSAGTGLTYTDAEEIVAQTDVTTKAKHNRLALLKLYQLLIAMG